MATDSTEAGYLKPLPPGPIYDQALEDFFQQVIVGITGVPGNLVRPRWQHKPPNLPSHETDWIAFGVIVGKKQWQAFRRYDEDLDCFVHEGVEDINVNVSFYGPNNESKQRMFEDGLQVEQNRDALSAQGISFKSVDDPVHLPALLKEAWQLRTDCQVRFQRWVKRPYPIRTILSAEVDIHTDGGLSTQVVLITPPSS